MFLLDIGHERTAPNAVGLDAYYREIEMELREGDDGMYAPLDDGTGPRFETLSECLDWIDSRRGELAPTT